MIAHQADFNAGLLSDFAAHGLEDDPAGPLLEGR